MTAMGLVDHMEEPLQVNWKMSPPHDALQDDARLSVMELRYQGSTCLTVIGVDMPWRYSASAMYANVGITNFKATIRKSTHGFTQRLAESTNSLIVAIVKSWSEAWSVRINIWNFWLQQHEFKLQMFVLLLVLYNECIL